VQGRFIEEIEGSGVTSTSAQEFTSASRTRTNHQHSCIAALRLGTDIVFNGRLRTAMLTAVHHRATAVTATREISTMSKTYSETLAPASSHHNLFTSSFIWFPLPQMEPTGS
jgi:hypothetical protein